MRVETPLRAGISETGSASPVPRLADAANRQVPGDSTALFRMAFGALAAVGSLRFLARGWVDSLYLQPENHLSYVGFGWVQPLPAPWMQLVVLGLTAAGVCIALGWHTRAAAVTFTSGFAYLELIDAALYLNHYWYLTLSGVLLCLLPVGRRWSLDARSGRVEASPTVPVGVIWALRGQLAVVYVFAGIAKLQSDWLLRAEPMATWLADRTDVPVFGSLLAVPAVAFAFSWVGALFDCTIVGWLLWSRTRLWAYVAVVAFHSATAMLFQIGMFPWVMILATPVFFDPGWPTGAWRWLRSRMISRASAQTVIAVGAPPRGAGRTGRPQLRGALLVLLAVMAIGQIVAPLRHLAIPGDVRWNEAGYYGSWRVMLTEKGGFARFSVTDPASGSTWEVGPELVLADWQAAQSVVRPDLLLATAHLVADHYRDTRGTDVEVRADAWVSMNGSPARPVVDPEVDLASVPRSDPPWWVTEAP